jgi:hypothetical protein
MRNGRFYLYLLRLPATFKLRPTVSATLFRSTQIRVRGRLHVSESAYESSYDSVHNLCANRIGRQFFFCYRMQWFVYTFQPKKSKISLLDPFGSKSYTELYGDSYGKLHVQTAPLRSVHTCIKSACVSSFLRVLTHLCASAVQLQCVDAVLPN